MRAPASRRPRARKRREHRGGNIVEARRWGRRWCWTANRLTEYLQGPKGGLLSPDPMPCGWALLPRVTFLTRWLFPLPGRLPSFFS